MRIVCISDTHSLHSRMVVPDGDVLVHAGDMTGRGTVAEIKAFAVWLDSLPHRRKLVIAGNHDFFFERVTRDVAKGFLRGIDYLQDSGVTVDGVSFWGSPWQPWFHDWAFNLPRDSLRIREKWDLIPAGTDVLVTHGPAYGILDRVASGENVGCRELTKAVHRISPRLHVFGHIHESHGRVTLGPTTHVNASICTLEYAPTNPAVVVDI